MILTPEQRAAFVRDGVIIVPGFYDVATEIAPIWRDLYDIIGLVITRHGLPIARPPFSPSTFDAGLPEILKLKRSAASEIYDAAKQIPAFIRLCASPRHDDIMRELRPGSIPGVAAGGYGVRMDHPFEDKYRANWHQEYPAQLRSMDGLVYWSPLVPVTEDLGPVEFCLGSHVDGPVRVHMQDARNAEKTGAYGLVLEDEESRIARYPHAAPLTNPGDLVIVDFLVLHASGFNRSARTRWSMQLRYFNFAHPSGVRIGWKGSYAAGTDFRTLHPELVVETT